MYKIKNIKKFAKKLGRQVAEDCGFSIEDLKSSISVYNVGQLIRENSAYDPESGERYISEKQIFAVSDEILNWINGLNLARMAADDEIDCYWSDDRNCMVFLFKKDLES